MIPRYQMDALYDAANKVPFKHRIIIHKGGHNTCEMVGRDEYYQAIQTFMKETYGHEVSYRNDIKLKVD